MEGIGGVTIQGNLIGANVAGDPSAAACASKRIAIPPTCFGHIDMSRQVDVLCARRSAPLNVILLAMLRPPVPSTEASNNRWKREVGGDESVRVNDNFVHITLTLFPADIATTNAHSANSWPRQFRTGAIRRGRRFLARGGGKLVFRAAARKTSLAPSLLLEQEYVPGRIPVHALGVGR